MKRGKNNYIYLFRHGQTTYNKSKTFTGHKDAKLSSEGKKHAKLIAQKLKNKRFEVAIHTRLSRSIDTLKPSLKSHKECKMIIQDDRMIERSYGELEGKKHKTLIDKKGIKEYDRIHRGWLDKAKNGESFKDVEIRVKDFIKDLKKLIRKNNVNVAISAHGNSIRLFRKIMEKASIKETTKWTIPYDKVFTYKI